MNQKVEMGRWCVAWGGDWNGMKSIPIGNTGRRRWTRQSHSIKTRECKNSTSHFLIVLRAISNTPEATFIDFEMASRLEHFWIYSPANFGRSFVRQSRKKGSNSGTSLWWISLFKTRDFVSSFNALDVKPILSLVFNWGNEPDPLPLDLHSDDIFGVPWTFLPPLKLTQLLAVNSPSYVRTCRYWRR